MTDHIELALDRRQGPPVWVVVRHPYAQAPPMPRKVANDHPLLIEEVSANPRQVNRAPIAGYRVAARGHSAAGLCCTSRSASDRNQQDRQDGGH